MSLFVLCKFRYYYQEKKPPKKTISRVATTENCMIHKLEDNDIVYKDWYNKFVSRAMMEKFFSPVLLDLGICYYRFGLSKHSTFWTSPTVCGRPNHPHFSLNGLYYHCFAVANYYLN